eukprot:COSAG01_NODE_334_length_18708_cov_49.649686_15_plen_322_part_00
MIAFHHRCYHTVATGGTLAVDAEGLAADFEADLSSFKQVVTEPRRHNVEWETAYTAQQQQQQQQQEQQQEEGEEALSGAEEELLTVRFTAPGALGLGLREVSADTEGDGGGVHVVVAALAPLPADEDEDDGGGELGVGSTSSCLSAEKAGSNARALLGVHVGHVLVSVAGETVAGLGLEAVQTRLRGLASVRPLTLQFGLSPADRHWLRQQRRQLVRQLDRHEADAQTAQLTASILDERAARVPWELGPVLAHDHATLMHSKRAIHDARCVRVCVCVRACVCQLGGAFLSVGRGSSSWGWVGSCDTRGAGGGGGGGGGATG